MHILQAINSDLSVLIVCNKTGGTIKGDKKIITNFQAVLGGHSCIEKLTTRPFATSVRNACPDLFVGLQTTHSFSLHP